MSVETKRNTVPLVRDSNHTCHVSNFNAVLQSFRWPNCDNFFNIAHNSQQILRNWTELVKNDNHRNVFQIQETLWGAGFFGIEYTKKQTVVRNLAAFHFQSLYVQETSFKDTSRKQIVKQYNKKLRPNISIHFFKSR